MPDVLAISIMILYAFALLFIFGYSLFQFYLTISYRKAIQIKSAKSLKKWEQWPEVTVQLPLYNEKYVVERLLECMDKLDYPSEKLQIQILDDSTDETTSLIRQFIEKGTHYQFEHLQRTERKGFKAGALQFGLQQAKGEFIAIFDADFLPPRDFLKRTLAFFSTERTGMVQSRWGHTNENYSLLTRFGLNAHFTVEQLGRHQGGHFINFNGTAGMWRKATIIDAGGWQADTLTEDLDLSYRAQLKGWEFRYTPDIVSPGELPAGIEALKTQQYRWNKGAAECARKHLQEVWQSRKLSFIHKAVAFFHLMNSGIFISIIIVSVLSVPMLWIKEQYPHWQQLFFLGNFFLLSLVFLVLFYFQAYKEIGKKRLTGFFTYFPLFLSISMGMSWHNCRAVISGYLGRRSPFVRTPKWNVGVQGNSWQGKQTDYGKSRAELFPLEVFFSGLFLLAIGLGIYLKDYSLIPFHLMLAAGFGYIAYLGLSPSR